MPWPDGSPAQRRLEMLINKRARKGRQVPHPIASMDRGSASGRIEEDYEEE